MSGYIIPKTSLLLQILMQLKIGLILVKKNIFQANN